MKEQFLNEANKEFEIFLKNKNNKYTIKIEEIK